MTVPQPLLTDRRPRRHRFVAQALVLLLAVSGGASAVWGQGAEPILEGDGVRRAELNKMQLKPFPAEAWGKLSDWRNGPALTPADISGKVVLIVTWSDFHPTSKRGMANLMRLAETKSASGLVCVAVHKSEGWDKAEKPAAPKGATLRLAHDAKDEFRKAILSDSDPDIYLIDRAGQLRFGDITSDSVEGAVDLLLAEKESDAANINKTISEARTKADADSRRAGSVRAELDLTKLPVLEFTKPSASEYKSAAWPKTPRDQQAQQSNAGGPIKRLDPRPVQLANTDWYPSKPNNNGRVTVIYFWHPDLVWTYDKTVREADLLQKEFGRDINVVGLLIVPQNAGGIDLRDDQKDPVKLKQRLKTFAEVRKYDHFITFDNNGTVWSSIATENPLPIPFWIVISSDGLARWWCSTTDGIDPRGAILDVIKNDPGVIARRKVEDEYIRNVSKGG